MNNDNDRCPHLMNDAVGMINNESHWSGLSVICLLCMLC